MKDVLIVSAGVTAISTVWHVVVGDPIGALPMRLAFSVPVALALMWAVRRLGWIS